MEKFKFNFEKLTVWQKARALSKRLYLLTQTFPQTERSGLCDQLRRAGVSVASNIAEGTSRTSFKDQERFIEIAYGSLMECCCQLQLAADIDLVPAETLGECRQDIREIGLMLNALKISLSTRRQISANAD